MSNDRVNQWYTNPGTYIAKAKERARLALNDPSIKLTTLERAFFQKYKEQCKSKQDGKDAA